MTSGQLQVLMSKACLPGTSLVCEFVCVVVHQRHAGEMKRCCSPQVQFIVTSESVSGKRQKGLHFQHHGERPLSASFESILHTPTNTRTHTHYETSL